MSSRQIHLYLAPSAAGKTAYVLDLVRQAARDPGVAPRVVVASYLQARSWRRRLAATGGTIGVRMLTFDRLYAECLNAAAKAYTELSEAVQYRLIRTVVDSLSLAHYAPLLHRPGFVQVLRDLIGELKAAQVHPDTFLQAVDGLASSPRLLELAQVYAAYQEHLQDQGWADRAGLGWLAVEALQEDTPSRENAQTRTDNWPLLVVDGFDGFSQVQLALLQALSERVTTMIITLTGTVDGPKRPMVYSRFEDTRQQLESALQVQAEPLPELSSGHAPALTHLEANFFDRSAHEVEAAGTLDLVAAPDRPTEVRAALRWLKTRLVKDGIEAHEVALLARDIQPYRPFILQTAREFGLPVRLLGGLPLRSNPAIAALLDLLRLSLPTEGSNPEPALPRRLVIEAWHSPYFDWSALPAPDATQPIGLASGDGDLLDATARWGRVIAGQSQWYETLDYLAGREQEKHPESSQDDDRKGPPAGVPVGAEARVLRAKFQRFVQRLTPPTDQGTYRSFVSWLEILIGPDPQIQSPRSRQDPEPTTLNIVDRARTADTEIQERDVVALQALKDVLRGLVWAEEALGAGQTVDYVMFFDELVGAIEAATYHLPLGRDQSEITVASVAQVRGVPYRAVALLGMAEGEFPASLSEDPFLPGRDRKRLCEEHGLMLEPSPQNFETEYFYEAITRPRERLLLTRPRLADNGAQWQTSPFWEETIRLVSANVQTLTSEARPELADAASWPELLESLAANPAPGLIADWVAREKPQRQTAVAAAAEVVNRRHSHAGPNPYDGDLVEVDGLAKKFGPDFVWSSSRLETYRSCPFFFFVGSVLRLEPRAEPAEGLDAAQLGNIYHHIFENLYQDPQVRDPTDLDQLLAALPKVADTLLDAAPEREGFRETAWWEQTRAEIAENVATSLKAMAELPGNFVPYLHEAVFGLEGQPPLVVVEGEDRFLVRGYIDRVDRALNGQLRIIDYKTGGPSPFSRVAVAEGKKLQLPIYALAARDALKLGEPTEGFYWHVRQAEHSGFMMSRFEGGPQGSMDTAVEYAWEAVLGARSGYFAPNPPTGGCPNYCPAAGFCWHQRPRFGG